MTVWADLDENGSADTGETTTVNVTWQKRPATATYTGPTVGEYHDPLTVSGRLVDGLTAAPLAGRSLTIGFGTDMCMGTTDGTGSASCPFTPQQVPGPYQATASFSGDTLYAPATSPNVPFTLNKEQTNLVALGPPFVANGLSATLQRDPDRGRSDAGGGARGDADARDRGWGTVVHRSGNRRGRPRGVHDPVVNQPLGVNPLTAAFAGDAYYLPSNAATTVVVFAWTNGGNFVIGDGNAATGGTATYWSSTWYLSNTVSGGVAPNAFKGFSNIPSGPTTCGAPNWSTGGGNSPPPAGTVPEYTAMLVTSSVTKSGAVISGTKPTIVIVKVNPGYSPVPVRPPRLWFSGSSAADTDGVGRSRW